MKIAVINGSVQQKNYTGYTLKIVRDELEENNIEVVYIDLKEFMLPFPGEKTSNDDSPKLQRLLKSCDAFVIGTPEYNGTFTAKLKLMIETSGYPSPMKGKPVSLIGVASGVLGAVKSLEHLRSVMAHIGAFTLPRVVSIAEIEKKFDNNGNCIDEAVEKEIKNSVENLKNYLNLIAS